jgi:hypothetical protein
MMHDIFYSVSNKPITKKKELLTEAHGDCLKWWVDVLDCSKSWSREIVEMSFDEIMDRLTKASLVTFIHRFNVLMEDNPFYADKEVDICGRPREYLEVGFRTMTTPDYFLWIYADIKHKDRLIEKYGLEELQ